MQAMETRPTTFVGVGLQATRAVSLTLAAVATLVAGMFEILAFGMTVGQQAGGAGLPDESWFRTWTWEYDYGAIMVPFRSAPLLVIGGLAVAAIAFGGCVVGRANAVRKAEHRVVATRWSVADQKARLGANLKACGWASVGSRHLRARVVIGAVASALVVLLTLAAPVDQGFTTGIGPTVCLVAGLVGIAGALLARPWEALPQLTIGSDGSLWSGSPSPQPPPALPVPTPAVAPSADWYPDPARRHELRYWDGDHWTSHVGDTGALSEDPEPVGTTTAGSSAP